MFQKHPIDLTGIERAIAKDRAPSHQQWTDQRVIDTSCPARIAQVPINIVIPQIEAEAHVLLDACQRLYRNRDAFRPSDNAGRVHKDERILLAEGRDALQWRCGMEIGPEENVS